jgi:hypothetical protein
VGQHVYRRVFPIDHPSVHPDLVDRLQRHRCPFLLVLS